LIEVIEVLWVAGNFLRAKTTLAWASEGRFSSAILLRPSTSLKEICIDKDRLAAVVFLVAGAVS
jgi:hypothetical protein